MSYTIQKYHGSYNRVARTSTPKYIVMHYVGAGTSATGSARANCIYFAGGNRNASAHYFIDDGSIYEYANPASWSTWHCGDGGGKYGITNANSIGIEVCINGNQPYTSAEIDRATWLVQKLMKQFGIPANRVVRHYDASRKACPYYYTPSGAGGTAAWNTLRAQLTGGTVSGGSSSSSGSSGSSSSGSSHSGTGFGGTYTCMVSALNIRTSPSTSGTVVGQYKKDQTVVLDDWYKSADGYIWGRYTAYSGNVRYVAVGRATGKVENDDYLVKKSASSSTSSTSSSSSSSNFGGTYRCNVSALNVRTSPSTSAPVVATYHKGQTVVLDNWHKVSGGYVWGRYTGGSGKKRYVAVGKATGKPEASDYLVKV